MDDHKILDLFWERDETAIRQTKLTHGAKLRRFAFSILKNNEDSEECENDTYLKAWNSIPPQRPQYFYAYLAKICRYTAFGMLDWKNAKKRKAEIVELTIEMEGCIPSSKEDVHYNQDEIGELLNRFLDNLSEDSRLIFMRRYWFSESIREIAERYHLGESKVKTSLFRTRKKLKEFLESEGEKDEWKRFN